jgi:hypothetical protein
MLQQMVNLSRRCTYDRKVIADVFRHINKPAVWCDCDSRGFAPRTIPVTKDSTFLASSRNFWDRVGQN